MANYYGDNSQLLQNVPEEKIDVKDERGRVRRLYDEITFAAELTTSDVLYMMKIPAGAKIIGGQVSCPDLGTTGVLNIGWEAGANGDEAADADGLFASLDVKAAANNRTDMAYSVAGFNKEFSEEVQVAIVPSESTDAATGLKFQLELFYVLD